MKIQIDVDKLRAQILEVAPSFSEFCRGMNIEPGNSGNWFARGWIGASDWNHIKLAHPLIDWETYRTDRAPPPVAQADLFDTGALREIAEAMQRIESKLDILLTRVRP